MVLLSCNGEMGLEWSCDGGTDDLWSFKGGTAAPVDVFSGCCACFLTVCSCLYCVAQL